MYKFTILAGLLAIIPSSVFASATYAFLNSESGSQNTEMYSGNSYPISPYGGSIGPNQNGVGNSPVQLFCDDFSDDSYWNTGWQANLTNVAIAAAANSSTNPWQTTRFGSANANTSYPVGTQLYEEIAWLFTQAVQTGQSVLNQDAIQEAVWLMTDPTGTPKATASNTGTNLTYLQWITDAGLYYNSSAAHTPTQFAMANYNSWYVVTDPTAAGNTGGRGVQEFLAYYTPGNPGGAYGTMQSGTPEPASFLLFGTGLLIVARLARRKVRS